MQTHESKNAKLLAEFTQYCSEHPEERFYQALRNWMGVKYVYVGDVPEFSWGAIEALGLTDTFFWINKND